MEYVLRPFVNIINFEIDVAAGLIIGISAPFGLVSFLIMLTKSAREQTQAKETIRLRLARDMFLAPNFEVGGDINTSKRY